ncbi:DUF5683 domain-containing protein [Fodinibius sp. SL11]|uniref:DUF5683 domain-containing protein n=1 Tax=Fodinibius sp. SL11 TaxID=3425690 RepID=UPI003F88065F
MKNSFSHITGNFNANTDVRYQNLYFRNDTTTKNINEDLPDPSSVLYKSMIIPGWGQIVNNQVWKVPIVYAVLGGLGYYSVHLTRKYHDYRAAYYNLNSDTPDDLRFGPTPSYIPENANLNEVRDLRNKFRNNRDLVYVGIVLAYGLNIIDAYVFAHMRSFDVSKDLSMRPRVKPAVMAQSNMPGLTLSIDLIAK